MSYNVDTNKGKLGESRGRKATGAKVVMSYYASQLPCKPRTGWWRGLLFCRCTVPNLIHSKFIQLLVFNI